MPPEAREFPSFGEQRAHVFESWLAIRYFGLVRAPRLRVIRPESKPLTASTELGTLDAIHLASALLWQEASGIDLAMTTHDKALGVAALAHGLKVLGT